MLEMEIYASQTKILENEASGRACLFDALRGCEYSIWATTIRKMHRKDTPDPLFHFPKSSFGRHKIVEKKGGLVADGCSKMVFYRNDTRAPNGHLDA